jgi:hypothetical protein
VIDDRFDRLIKSGCVYVMKTVITDPHSNEMRLTDRYNVHTCPCNNVGDILNKKASVSVHNYHAMMHDPFSKTNKSIKVQVINE